MVVVSPQRLVAERKPIVDLPELVGPDGGIDVVMVHS